MDDGRKLIGMGVARTNCVGQELAKFRFSE